MTPKEKAIALYTLFYDRIEHTLSEEYSPHEKDIVKSCALISVNETMKAIGTVDRIYWKEVKQEIEKL